MRRGYDYRTDRFFDLDDPYSDLYDWKWVDPWHTDEKSSHPYSYSEFFHFGSREVIKKASGAYYSDRLNSWDPAKMDRLWKEHVGARRWEQAGADRLSAFLSAYAEKKLSVIALAEGCNVSNGYPYFIMWVRENLSRATES